MVIYFFRYKPVFFLVGTVIEEKNAPPSQPIRNQAIVNPGIVDFRRLTLALLSIRDPIGSMRRARYSWLVRVPKPQNLWRTRKENF